MPTTVSESASATYYYADGKKINLTRRDDLIAVKFQSRATPESLKQFQDKAAVQFEPSDEFKEMQQGSLRFFRVPTDRAVADTRAFTERMREQAGVEKIGDVFTNEYGQPLVLTRELVCRFKPGLSAQQIEDIKKTFALEEVEKLTFTDSGFVLSVKPQSERNALEVANALVEGGHAVYAAPNFIEHIGFRQAAVAVPTPVRHGLHPTDPMFPQQWHLDNTGQLAGGTAGTPGADAHATLAWMATMGNPNLRLAVIDMGVDINHNDLNAPGKVVDPIDFDVSPPDSNPLGGAHGTQVAGMAVATASNGVVGAGCAPNCKLIPIKASDVGTQTQMAHAFVYAADHGASVITCSLGPVGPWTMQSQLREAIDYATTFGRNGRGCVYTQAVDNAPNPINIDQVSAFERSIAVSRTNNRDLYDGAAMGVELDLCAPGRDVLLITNTTATNASTSTVSTGTSFATPLTAGVALLVLSVDPARSWEEVRQVLLDSSDKIDAVTNPYTAAPVGRPPGTRNDRYGYGRVNAEAALQHAGVLSQRDLVIRDTPADTGTVPQGDWGYWDSPDIWVRNADDGGTSHQNTIRGQDNYVYVRVTNRGAEASLPCWVRFLITTYAGTKFSYPFDFKRDTTAEPAGGTPGNLKDSSAFPAPGSYLIGTQRIESIPAGGDFVAKVKWEKAFIPPALGWHPCLLAEISPHDGPMPTGAHVWENNNLGQKNITIVNAMRRKAVNLQFKYSDLVKHLDPFTSLELRWTKPPLRRFPVHLDLKDPRTLDAIKPEFTSVRSEGEEEEQVIETSLEPEAGAEQLTPLRLTFMEEATIAINSEGGAGDTPISLTFPRGSTVEIGRGELPVVEEEAMGATEASEEEPSLVSVEEPALAETRGAEVTPIDTRAGIVLPKLKTVLTMSPNKNSAVLKLPSFGTGLKDAALRFQVPANARIGETCVLDVAQRNARGQLLGGVRFRINIIAG